MTQFYPQNCTLKTFHPAVISLDHVMVFPVGSPVAESADGLRMVWIARCARAALAVSSQVLGGIKTETADIADASSRTPPVFRPVGLRGVLDDDEPSPPRYFQDGIHIGRLAVEMYRQNRLGAGSDGGLDCSGGHIERPRL